MNKNIVKKVVGQIITCLFYVALLFMFFVIGSALFSKGEPQLFGYQIKIVLSGSMEPGIKTGSIIFVKTGGDMTRFKENDVISFKESKNRIVTHRVVKVINKNGQVMYRTKGDSNKTRDTNPVVSNNVVGEYTNITIPYLGYAIEFTKSKNGKILLFIIPGLLIFAYSLINSSITYLKLKKNNTPTNNANTEPPHKNLT
ncbi:signal peptidase I SipW [Fredinandcohnia sp. 179-A 10B2 NHS]|uniref:signal peptidase I SipW n=1 Tax=Fredinandcohnia sp. 179-A 10B2 NHS TaxID=3235176 RepID=UPI0039A3B91E